MNDCLRVLINSRLKRNARRGSKPRCHLITHGKRDEVAKRLTELITPWGEVTASDCWMPQGFDFVDEAQLHQAPSLLTQEQCDRLAGWWFAVKTGDGQNSPNWDIASTCRIGDRDGLLLVEAKAHHNELKETDAGHGSGGNCDGIRHCVDDANLRLGQATGLRWELSCEHHYQMSNRFTWASKLTEMGIPVILLYLGFLNADDMADRGKPFEAADAWENLVKEHSKPLFPGEIWGKEWTVAGQMFVPLIVSRHLSLP